MDLLGALKQPSSGSTLPGGELPGLGGRPGKSAAGKSTAGEEAPASFASYLATPKPATVSTGIAADEAADDLAEGASLASLPTTVASLSPLPRPMTAPRPSRKSAAKAETGTDSSDASAEAKDEPSIAAPAATKSTDRTPSLRSAATTSVSTALSATVTSSAQLPVAPVPPSPPQVGDSTTSVDPDGSADIASTIEDTSSVARALPTSPQLTSPNYLSGRGTPVPVAKTAQNQSVPLSSSTPTVGQGGSVPPSSLAASGPPADPSRPVRSVPLSSTSDQSESVPLSSSEAATGGSVPFAAATGGTVPVAFALRSPQPALAEGSVPVSNQSVPLASAHQSVPADESVPLSGLTGSVPISDLGSVTDAENESVPVSVVPARAHGVSARSVSTAYRTAGRGSSLPVNDDESAVNPAAATAPAEGEANLAAAAPTTAAPAVFSKMSGDKNSLDAGKKDFADATVATGTGIADSSAMPANFSSNSRSTSAAVGVTSVRVTGRDATGTTVPNVSGTTSGSTGSSFSLTGSSSDRSASAAAVTARDAVATVVKLADAQQARTEANSGTVNLGFKFGDEHLGVRVEMRSGQVHTQFTTSSPELREALATQFVALTGGASSSNSGQNGNSSRNYQFAEPQFSGSGGGQDGSRGDNSAAPSESPTDSFSSAGSADAVAAPTATSSAPLSDSTLRLQALA